MQKSTEGETTQQVDINDVFDNILFSEEKIIEEGYQQGFEVGSNEDNIEGYHLGYHRGAEIGSELGYYQAFVEHYLGNSDHSNTSEKIVKSLEFLKLSVKAFPRANSKDEDIINLAEKIRLLYKKICVQLKVVCEFKKEGLSF